VEDWLPGRIAVLGGVNQSRRHGLAGF